MKLLNSDKIVDFIDKHSKAIDEDYEKTYTLDQIQEYLDAMPADYDVEKVVAELENYFDNEIDQWFESCVPDELYEYKKTVPQIVRKGGIENE